MELERRYVTLNHKKGNAASQVTLEEDLNVPDQKADIFRVLHKRGEFRLDEIKGETGKVKIRGTFLYWILYMGEGQERMPEILEGSIPVDEIVFLNDLEEGDVLDFHWSMEDLHASAIHSRKANVKCVLTLSVEAVQEQPVPLMNSHPEETDLYVRTCPVRLQQEVIHKKDTLRIKEEMNLPPGRPNMRRILWREMCLQGTEVRQEEGRFLVKGELLVFFLYECEDEPGRLQWLEQGIPFHQEVECDGCRSDLTGKAEVTLLRGELELQADYDGEPRMVRIDVVLELLFRYFEEVTSEVLCDAYSLTREIRPRRQQYQWDWVRGISDSRARVNGRMKLGDTDPKVLQILNSGAQVHLDHTERNGQGVVAQGTVDLWVLYAASDDSQPLACAVHSFPFEHTVEQEDTEKCEWRSFLCLDQLTVTMLDAQELEMKAVLQMQTMFEEPVALELVEDLEEEPLDMDRIRRMPGMVIHIVQPGETLWDISKAHATTCEAVMELNELKEENLKTGQKILMVKEIAR